MNFCYCFLLFLSITQIYCQSDVAGTKTEFEFYVPAKEKRCFGEDIASKTLFSTIVTVQDPTYTEFEFTLIDPEKRIVNRGNNTAFWKVLYTAVFSGDHQFCMINRGQKDMKVLFQMLQDADMAYVSSLALKSTLPLWADVISITLKVEHIKMLADTLTDLEESNFSKSDSIFNYLMLFSGLFVIVSVLITWYSIRYMKNFFSKKKFI